LGRGRGRRTAGTRQTATATDLSYARFVADVVELEPDVGDTDTRVLAGLTLVREALERQQATDVARYLALASALDAARRGAGSAASAVLEHLSNESLALAGLIDGMRLAADAISHGIGVPAVASLLIAPQREIVSGDVVVLLGAFAVRGQPEQRCVVKLRWRQRRKNGFYEVEFEDIDEPGADDPEQGIEKLLRALAVEIEATPQQVRARAAFVIGPTKLADLGDLDAARRRVTAAAVVRDVAVEFFPVTDPRRTAEIDRPLADRGFDVLLLDVDPQDQWAFNRARQFEERGGQVAQLGARELEPLVDEVGTALRGLVGGPDVEAPSDLEREIPSALTEAEQNEVRAALRASSLRVVFVGGNETQEQYRSRIEAALVQRYGDRVEVAWFGGWASSWNAIEDAAVREFATAGGLVVMQFMRTQLGNNLRRRAGEAGIAWHRCAGSGRQAMQHALEQALLLAARGRTAVRGRPQ
jgi:hypothetical protein